MKSRAFGEISRLCITKLPRATLLRATDLAISHWLSIDVLDVHEDRGTVTVCPDVDIPATPSPQPEARRHGSQ